jgi:hypothetical protein
LRDVNPCILIDVRSEVFTAETEERHLLGYRKPGSYFTGDTLLLRYRAQPVNAV